MGFGMRGSSVMVAIWLLAASVSAHPCDGSVDRVGCFDASRLPGPFEPSPWRGLGWAEPVSYGSFAMTLLEAYAHRPVDLVAPSPDAEGRTIHLVESTLRAEIRAGIGLGRATDLAVSLPMALHQSGAGPEAIASQRPAALPSFALADPSIAFRVGLPEGLAHLAWSLRLELGTPLGNEQGYLGERGFSESLALAVAYRHAGWGIAADSGFRFAPETTFGDAHLGTSAIVGFGVSRTVPGLSALSLALEVSLRPVLIEQPRDPSEESRIEFLLPAEWLSSLAWSPSHSAWALALGGGTALPLSRRSHLASWADSTFYAPTAPRWRVILSLAILCEPQE